MKTNLAILLIEAVKRNKELSRSHGSKTCAIGLNNPRAHCTRTTHTTTLFQFPFSKRFPTKFQVPTCKKPFRPSLQRTRLEDGWRPVCLNRKQIGGRHTRTRGLFVALMDRWRVSAPGRCRGGVLFPSNPCYVWRLTHNSRCPILGYEIRNDKELEKYSNIVFQKTKSLLRNWERSFQMWYLKASKRQPDICISLFESQRLEVFLNKNTHYVNF